MKIVCDACDTRYAIDDARLPGNRFKIRCRKCDHLVVVKANRSLKPRWHLVVKGEEVGPLTTSEIHQGITTGDIRGETMVWRDGMANWKSLSEIEELRPDPLETDAWRRGTPMSNEPSTEPSSGQQAPASGGGLFDDVDHAPSAVDLVASRNESSVLFSISNLRDLALQDSGPKIESGLIDIRSLAPKPATSTPEPTRQESAFAPYVTTGALLVPTEKQPTRWVLPTLAGLGAALVVTVVALVVLVAMGNQKPATAAEVPAPPVKTPEAVKPEKAKTPPPAPAPVVEPQKSPDTAPKRELETTPKVKARPKVRRAKRPIRKHSPKAQVAAKKVKKSKANRPPEDEITRLINNVIGDDGKEKPKARRAKARPAADLPTSLEKHQIRSGIFAIRARVRACFNQFRVPGQSQLKLTIAPSGRMARVAVRGMFAGTPTGACVRRAFMTAKFPRFSGPALTVSYPVIFR